MSKNCATNTLWIEHHIHISNSWANYIIVASLDRLPHSPCCLASNSQPSCLTYASMYHIPCLVYNDFLSQTDQILLDFSFVVVVVFFCFVLLCFFGFFLGGWVGMGTGSCYVAQADLTLMSLPASASQLLIYSVQTQNLWATNLDKLLFNTSLLIRKIGNNQQEHPTLSMGTEKIKQ